ncbi:DUF5107 domain-containing protein [Kineococcus sp. SYSU DK005]|uniref:DUF5107 domain-containing protein n=1 Tax=Kineococcus sp. SYSU DK005 TaxID=3383126 RepID=UPI003D7EE0A2
MLSAESRIALPPVPAQIAGRPVRVWREPVVIDTYEPDLPDRYPAYLDQRVYQGSSGAVYPMPFTDRISQDKRPRRWDAVHLDNDFVRLMILPELGGRIHVGLDKTRDYDFFYRNDVIKPALVGLLGPWISGGVEFNWPQHHRPATYLPTEASIEEEADGAVTVWCSDHDPFQRMQGMHGVRLRPASALIELRANVVNRTAEVQTFLWWANVAAAVNDEYQSFFPTDVHVVADHAKRAMTTFPAAQGRYYGVDYPAQRTPQRPDGDRLDWYRNIPVPTSYMCLSTQDDFFGGYDHRAGAGFVHWADHRFSPGKKQWTWGNAPFGWAWDAHLTDRNGPYVELMAGVFTDNQPDFAFLRPGETKRFSQYWYPIQDIGPVHQATREAAVRLDVRCEHERTRVRVGVASTALRPGSVIEVRADGELVHAATADLAPGRPYAVDFEVGRRVEPTGIEVLVRHEGAVLLTWRPRAPQAPADGQLPAAASEPPTPQQIGTLEELYLTGLHLQQYRHATRSPEPYWHEALRRDAGDARCNVALAGRRQFDGRLEQAEAHLRSAVARLTHRNPNPRDGEAHYRLGVVLTRLRRAQEARAALGTAMWDQAWAEPATIATARLDLASGRDRQAAEALEVLLQSAPRSVQARNLATVAALRLGESERAAALVHQTLQLNALDAWARHLAARLSLPTAAAPTDDPTIALDVALEYLSIREDAAAAAVLQEAARLRPTPGQRNVAPLAWLYLAQLELLRGDEEAAGAALQRARQSDRRWCFPAHSDNDLLAALRARWPEDTLLAGLAGHWLYAAGRREEAIEAWQVAAAGDDSDPVVLRNLGIAAYNVHRDTQAGAYWFERARKTAPDDARLLFEADQLEGRRGTSPQARLDVLLDRRDLVEQRDDLCAQLAELLTATGRPAEALEVLGNRRFQPWEGGEGRVLAAWEAAHLSLARQCLRQGLAEVAVRHAEHALQPPASLGEARHALANTAELHLVLGDAAAAAGDAERARQAWRTSAQQQGDFQGMQVQAYSERTAASVTALRRLGEESTARALRNGLADYAHRQSAVRADIDYFATSLPTMLLFATDVQQTHDLRTQVLRAQLALLDGHSREALELARQVLHRDPLNTAAADVVNSASA